MSQLCALSSAYSSGSTRWRLLGGPRCRRHPKQARRTLPLTCQDGNIHFFCKEFIMSITFSAPGLSLPGTHDKFRLNANRRIPSAGVMSPVLRLQTKTALMLSDKSEWAQGSWEHLLLLLKEMWIGNTQTTLELPFPHREVSPHISQAGAGCRTSLWGLFSCDWGRQLSPKYLKLLKTQSSLDRSHC